VYIELRKKTVHPLSRAYTANPAATAETYRAALKSFLSRGGEAALSQAYEIGRRALAEGLSARDLVAIHHQALALIPDDPRNSRADDAHAFLMGCLCSLERSQRNVIEANAALHRINDALESDLKRIAHALHDEPGQILVSVYLALQQLARELPDDYHAHVEGIRGLLDGVETQLRHLAHELRPTMLDHLGLLPALRFLAERLSSRTGILTKVEGRIDKRLPPAVETRLYRAVQDALDYVVRQAQASQATVRLSLEDRRVRCTVVDNGRGFRTPPSPGVDRLGLVGIRERLRPLDGDLMIRSAPRRGTELEITIPLEGCRWQSEL
jgi:signal transduction histidine kinase